MMNRKKMLSQVEATTLFDVIVIGGGASGLGTALDSTLRGYKTLLLEKDDFAKGTSSRSTKLAHGGVRYLKQGDVGMVREALRERGLMKENAPHLVHDQKFIVPVYDWWDAPLYTTGLKVYDVMAGSLGLGKSEMISKEKTLKHIPNLSQDGLIGGVRYYDGQFDDARLAITLAQTISDFEGNLLNYAEVVGLEKDELDKVDGVRFIDSETGTEHVVKGTTVVNATGVFVDQILSMDDKNHKPVVSPSQGVHIILDKEFLKGASSIMVPRTSDGRVLFAVPWYDKIVVGTTDTPLDSIDAEPRALEEEIEFILKTAGQYLQKAPKRSDVRSVFAGLRPLVKKQEVETKNISRSHKILVNKSSLITIVGGKWTTYRQMAEDAVDTIEKVAHIPSVKCITKDLLLHGYQQGADRLDVKSVYGNDLPKIEALITEAPKLGVEIHSDLPYRFADVYWGVKNEMARTVEDVLARRTRSLLLNACASIEAAPEVAKMMAGILGKDEVWVDNQIEEYTTLAKGYMC
ncbi:glycerol-3-phosphate dehydrogenase/oxidase [Flammeovirga pectinis]|nr:glycerol-3-phosphate dehydrogenase/oxidase [Flammeovirga pectinis]